MNTPRLLFMFGLFLPLTLICPPGNRMFTQKYSFWVSGFTWQSWLIPVSRSRGLLSPLLTDVVIGLLLNVTHYMPFILPDAPHRTDYSQSEGDKKKLHFTIKNFFPKKIIKKSINQLFMSIRGMGLRRSSEPMAHVWNKRIKANKGMNSAYDILVHFLDLHFRLSMLLH